MNKRSIGFDEDAASRKALADEQEYAREYERDRATGTWLALEPSSLPDERRGGGSDMKTKPKKRHLPRQPVPKPTRPHTDRRKRLRDKAETLDRRQESAGGASKKVRAFCQRFSAELEAGFWGEIEPELFRNIAEGYRFRWFNKMTADEMADGVVDMIAILEKTLP